MALIGASNLFYKKHPLKNLNSAEGGRKEIGAAKEVSSVKNRRSLGADLAADFRSAEPIALSIS